MQRTILFFLATVLGLSPGESPAQVLVQRARADLPVVVSLSPVGVQPGQTVEITASGERLEGLTAILGPAGVKLGKVAGDAKQVRFDLAVAADAVPGIYPLHLLAQAGLSNPRLLRIDPFPQLVEQEENNSPNQATHVPIPSAANGVLIPADVDWYRFEATAGQELVFDIEAQRLGSSLRPVLALFDAAGRQIARAATPPPDIAPDVRLAYTFAQGGTYLLRVSDLVFSGSDAAAYHLRIGPIPFAASMFPLGGRRGTKVTLTLAGGNLQQPLTHEVDLAGDVSGSLLRLQVPSSAGMVAAPALFALGDVPEIIEQEPNSEPAAAQPITPGLTINGRIDPPGDRDLFRFQAAAGAKLNVRVLARDLGSRLDSVVTISDATGKELVSLDDRKPVGREPPVVRAINGRAGDDDAALEFIAPAAGDYVLSIEDLYGRGGAAYAYRLEMAPPRPNFELLVQPTVGAAPRDPKTMQQPQQGQVMEEFSGAGTGALSIDRGGTGALFVRAVRNGYNGPIRLAVENLPPGVQVGPGLIAAGQNDTLLNLTADFDAASAAGFIRIVGTGEAEGVPLARVARQPVVLSSVRVNGACQQELGVVALAISRQGAELALRGTFAAPLTPGGAATLRVAVRRREGIAGDVAIELLNLPTGLAATAGKVGADRQDVELPVTGGLDLLPGRHTFLVEGTLTVADRKEPILSVFPVEFEVLPVVALELAAQQVDVPQGGSATVEVNVRRHAPLSSPIELSLGQLPKGLGSATTSIPVDVDRFSLVIEAGETAAASPIRRIVQLKAKVKIGEQSLELPTLRFALKVTKKP